MNLAYTIPIVITLVIATILCHKRHKRRMRKARELIMHHVRALDAPSGCSRPDVHLEAILEASNRYGLGLGSSPDIPHWATLMLKASGSLSRYSETQHDLLCGELESPTLSPESKRSLEKLWRVFEARAQMIGDYVKNNAQTLGTRSSAYDLKLMRDILTT